MSKQMSDDTEDGDEGENNSQIVLDIRKKYERKLAAHQGAGTEVCTCRHLQYQ